jgi:hypothetical protein
MYIIYMYIHMIYVYYLKLIPPVVVVHTSLSFSPVGVFRPLNLGFRAQDSGFVSTFKFRP